MIGSELGLNPATIGVFAALFAFGVAYSFFVNNRPRHEMDAFVSLYVVVGVLVTLLGVAILDLAAAILVLLCFVCSGTPMVLGSLARYSKVQGKFIEDARRQVEEGERKLSDKS